MNRAKVSTMVEQTAIQRFTERFFFAADAELVGDETEVDTAAWLGDVSRTTLSKVCTESTVSHEATQVFQSR